MRSYGDDTALRAGPDDGMLSAGHGEVKLHFGSRQWLLEQVVLASMNFTLLSGVRLRTGRFAMTFDGGGAGGSGGSSRGPSSLSGVCRNSKTLCTACRPLHPALLLKPSGGFGAEGGEVALSASTLETILARRDHGVDDVAPVIRDDVHSAWLPSDP